MPECLKGFVKDLSLYSLSELRFIICPLRLRMEALLEPCVNDKDSSHMLLLAS